MQCGVPVAQPVHHDDDNDDDDDGSDENEDEDAPEQDVENGGTPSSSAAFAQNKRGSNVSSVKSELSTSHLQYLGQDVVIATRADSMEQGQANNSNVGGCDGNITSEHEEDGSKTTAEDIAHAHKKRRYILGGIILGILVTVAAVGIILGTNKSNNLNR